MRTIFKIGAFFGMFLLIPGLVSYAQVSINNDSSQPDGSAMLDVKSNNKGFLPPRLALSNINSSDPITSPSVGLLIYNTAIAGTPPNNVMMGYYYWNGTRWISLSLPMGTKIGDMLYWNGTSWIPTDTITRWTGTTGKTYLSGIKDSVGIGTNNPKHKLETIGDFFVETPTMAWDSSGGIFEIFSNGNAILGSKRAPQPQMSGLMSGSGITSKFELQSENGFFSDMAVKVSANNSDYAPFFWFAKSEGTLNNPQNVVNGERIGGMVAAPFYNTIFRTSAKWAWFVNGTPSGDTVPLDLIYYNHGADIWTDGGIERFRIKDNGNIGINTSVPAEKLEVNGNTKSNGFLVSPSDTTGIGSTAHIGMMVYKSSDNHLYLLQGGVTPPTWVMIK